MASGILPVPVPPLFGECSAFPCLPTDQDEIALVSHESACCQIAHQSCVDQHPAKSTAARSLASRSLAMIIWSRRNRAARHRARTHCAAIGRDRRKAPGLRARTGMWCQRLQSVRPRPKARARSPTIRLTIRSAYGTPSDYRTASTPSSFGRAIEPLAIPHAGARAEGESRFRQMNAFACRQRHMRRALAVFAAMP